MPWNTFSELQHLITYVLNFWNCMQRSNHDQANHVPGVLNSPLQNNPSKELLCISITKPNPVSWGNIFLLFLWTKMEVADLSVSRTIYQGSKDARKWGTFWTLYDWKHAELENTKGDIGDSSHMNQAISFKITWYFNKNFFTYVMIWLFLLKILKRWELYLMQTPDEVQDLAHILRNC